MSCGSPGRALCPRWAGVPQPARGEPGPAGPQPECGGAAGELSRAPVVLRSGGERTAPRGSRAERYPAQGAAGKSGRFLPPLSIPPAPGQESPCRKAGMGPGGALGWFGACSGFTPVGDGEPAWASPAPRLSRLLGPDGFPYSLTPTDLSFLCPDGCGFEVLWVNYMRIYIYLGIFLYVRAQEPMHINTCVCVFLCVCVRLFSGGCGKNPISHCYGRKAGINTPIKRKEKPIPTVLICSEMHESRPPIFKSA